MEYITKAFKALDDTSLKLISLMDDQISAITMSDTEKIEALTEEHAFLIGEFKKHEEQFILELGRCLESEEDEDRGVKLIALKKVFPESAELIEEWKNKLTENTGRLQKKHEQLVDLLEFAMVQNAKLMRSYYGAGNEKNTHYSSKGTKSGFSSGLTINEEA